MTYPDSHWEEVAKLYKGMSVHPTEVVGGKTYETVVIKKMQDHYPWTSERTVQGWVKKCKDKGLI